MIIDEGLDAPEQLKEAIRKVRADIGRDLSRRTVGQGRRLAEASDDRSAYRVVRVDAELVRADVGAAVQLIRAALAVAT